MQIRCWSRAVHEITVADSMATDIASSYQVAQRTFDNLSSRAKNIHHPVWWCSEIPVLQEWEVAPTIICLAILA